MPAVPLFMPGKLCQTGVLRGRAFAARVLAMMLAAIGLSSPAMGEVARVGVAASSEQGPGFGITNIFDRNVDTRWASQFSDNQWLQIDLFETQEVDLVEIVWEAAHAAAYEVDVSTDRTRWTTVFATTNSAGGTEEAVFALQPARYIRIRTLKRATEWGNSIRELDIAREGRSILAEGCRVTKEIFREPVLALDVNQAFYAPRARKTAVVRSSEKMGGGAFVVLSGDGEEVLRGEPAYWGRYWGYHFWQVRFSAVQDEGAYVLRVSFDDGRATEAKVRVGIAPVADAVEKTLTYFYTQRCGMEIPGWHKLCHTDDGTLPDGRHYDASGGWHDCAGFDKETYTTWLPVYLYATIASESDLPWKERMMEEARWGADWLMRMTDTNGYTWCHVEPHNYGPEEFIKTWSNGTSTDNIVGTPDDRKITQNAWGPEEAVQAMCAGALAKLGWLLRETDAEYSARCVAKARLILDYLRNRDYFYADEYPLGRDGGHYNVYHTGQLLADMYLYQLGGGEEDLRDARKRIDFLVDYCQSPDGEYLNSSIERVPVSGKSFDPYVNVLCFAEFCALFPDDPQAEKARASVAKFFRQVRARVGVTPYDQAQLMDAGLYHYIAVNTFQRNFEKPGGKVCQGKNCYWLSLATVCFLADELLGTEEYADIGVRQIDWVLGQNPFGVSTVAEVGQTFPRMFTMWYWLDDHPAAEGVIPGGSINGIGGDADDMPALDMRQSNWLDWETNEYWNPPTAWFAMACWQYYKYARMGEGDVGVVE